MTNPNALEEWANRLEARIEKRLAELTRRIYELEKRFGLDYSPETLPEEAKPEIFPQSTPEILVPKSLATEIDLPQMDSEDSRESLAAREPLMHFAASEPHWPITPGEPHWPITAGETSRPLAASEPPATAEPPQSETPRTPLNWETIIGGKWSLWVGSVLVFLAAAFFFPTAWQHLNPQERMGAGLLAGIAFLGAGEFFRSDEHPWFSDGLGGTGIALLYLTIWAGIEVFQLLSFETAFAAMGCITAVGIVLSVRHEAESLSVLAALGGFLTPFLLHASEPAIVLTYIAILDSGILALSLFKRWAGIKWLSFTGTILIFFGPILNNAIGSNPLTTGGKFLYFNFFTLYYLLFFGASCFYSLVHREETAPEDLLLLFADTSIYSGATYALSLPTRFPAGFPLALALFFLCFGWVVRMRAEKNLLLKSTLWGIAIFFLTVSIPIQLRQMEIPIGWSVEAAVLITLASAYDLEIFRQEGTIVWILAGGMVIYSLIAAGGDFLPFLRQGALPLLTYTLSTGWMAWDPFGGEEPDTLSSLCSVVSCMAGAWLLAEVTYLAFRWKQIPSPETWTAGALYSVSILWTIYAFVVTAFGFLLRNMSLRRTAVVIAALAGLLLFAVTGTQNTEAWFPVFNLRFLCAIVAGFGPGFIGWIVSRNKEKAEPDELSIVPAASIIARLVLLWGLSAELYLTFAHFNFPSAETWQPGALYAVSILCGGASALWLWIGMRNHRAELKNLAYFVSSCAVVLLIAALMLGDLASWAPYSNLRFFDFACLSATFFLFSLLMRKNREHLGGWEKAFLRLPIVLSSLFILWGGSVDLYAHFLRNKIPSEQSWQPAALFAISMLWSAAAAILYYLGCRKHRTELRAFSILSGSLALFLTFFTIFASIGSDLSSWRPFSNFRFWSFLFATLMSAMMAYWMRKNQNRLTSSEKQIVDAPPVVAVIAGLWGMYIETYAGFAYDRPALGDHWDRMAQLGISLEWVLCGSVLLILGILFRYQLIRILGLGLLGLTVIKVFGFDLHFLPTPYRVLSFLGLGIALIGISWLYTLFGRSISGASE